MQTNLADFIRDTPDGEEAAGIIGRCVHCGFCNATCPTYQLCGDELDGPRGRIYLMKQVLEGATPSASTQLHLDRCLGCLGCETTCPSGVEYGRLLDIGRRVVAEQTSRPPAQTLARAALRHTLMSRAFAPALKLGQALRPLLPAALREKIPPTQNAGAWPARSHARQMLLLRGCVQPAMLPNIDAATARVLDAFGIQTIVAPEAGCCGALHHQLDDPERSLQMARRNIDAWLPYLDSGSEAILMNASGCGAHVREYAHLLRNDPDYAAQALRVSALTKDLCEVLPALLAESAITLAAPGPRVVSQATPSFPRKQEPIPGPRRVFQATPSFPRKREPIPDPRRVFQATPSFPRKREPIPSPRRVFQATPSFPRKRDPIPGPRKVFQATPSFPRKREPIPGPRVVFQAPCSLQHGQKITGTVEAMLTALGCDLLGHDEAHLCCGAAGSYSLTQPAIAQALRDRKLANLDAVQPELILSANVGCIAHLQAATETPVMHWIEWLDACLGEAR